MPEDQPIQFYSAEPQGFALWRMPGSERFFFTAGNWKPARKLDTSEFSRPGFLFHPFDKENADLFLLSENIGVLAFSSDELDELSIKGLTSVSIPDFPRQFDWMGNEDREKAFVELVSKAVQKIKKGDLEKVVTSRVEIEDSSKSPWEVFKTLSERHPNAFISFVSIENLGQWIGASPELLCRSEKDGSVKTVALAGTSRDGNFGQKEKQEQGLVGDYIENRLSELGIRDFQKGVDEKLDLGGMTHLQTKYEITLPKHINPGLLVEQLHPTPAVGGIPGEESQEFIRKNENHPRSYYSGFLGPYASEKVFTFYVNLRCMQIFKDKAVLYAGAGITADSDPEKELEETRLKLKSLKDALE